MCMNIDEIPQDHISTMAGFRKASYALDKNGRYITAPTSGWKIEETALLHVIDEYKTLAETARKNVFEGRESPLRYFMFKRYMDTGTLAQAMGLPVRKVKRHCRVSVFRKLPRTLLDEYARILRIDTDKLTTFDGNQL